MYIKNVFFKRYLTSRVAEMAITVAKKDRIDYNVGTVRQSHAKQVISLITHIQLSVATILSWWTGLQSVTGLRRRQTTLIHTYRHTRAYS